MQENVNIYIVLYIYVIFKFKTLEFHFKFPPNSFILITWNSDFGSFNSNLKSNLEPKMDAEGEMINGDWWLNFCSSFEEAFYVAQSLVLGVRAAQL